MNSLTNQNWKESERPTVIGFHDDEIKLIDLWAAVVRRKLIILFITAIVAAGAVLHALLAPDVFKTEVIFLPPTVSDIQEFNIDGFSKFNVDSVFGIFKKNLKSRAPRQAFFEKQGVIKLLGRDQTDDIGVEVLFEEFNKRLLVAEKNPAISISFEGNQPKLVAETLNQIAYEILNMSTTEIIKNIQTAASIKKKELQNDIELLRDKAKKRRSDDVKILETNDALRKLTIQDRIKALRDSAKFERLDKIEMLKSAASIAHSLGIEDPIEYKLRKILDASLGKSQIMAQLSDDNPQLYKNGFKALEAEIKILENRKSDDPFISELRYLQTELSQLGHNREAEQLKARKDDDPFIPDLREKQSEIRRIESIQIDATSVKTARIDKLAFPPQQRIKPKRTMIVTFGVVLGLMLGIIFSLFSAFIERQRKDSKRVGG